MSHLPVELQDKLKEIFQTAGFAEEKINTEIEAIEKELFSRFMVLALKKLPDQERVAAVALANQNKAIEVDKKMQDWYNPSELEQMWDKIIKEMLVEICQNLYKDADEETKKKLEQKIKPEVLKNG